MVEADTIVEVPVTLPRLILSYLVSVQKVHYSKFTKVTYYTKITVILLDLFSLTD